MKKRNVDWAAYDKSLKQRGNITFWISDDVVDHWLAEPTGNKGRSPIFSNMTIEACLTLRLLFKQALRQTEGLITSLFELMGVNLVIPDHSTLSRRGKDLNISDPDLKHSSEPIIAVLDSTGLKTYGAGEWNETKHGLSKQRIWRKFHITINGTSIEIIDFSLTSKNVGDLTEGQRQLSQMKSPLKEVLADGAYDSGKIYETANAKGVDGKTTITIPPPKNAVVSKDFPESKTQRDEHVDFINANGRNAWEFKTGYSRRLLVENAIGRYKQIIGSKLYSRSEENQKTETSIGCKILNRMVRLGTPLRPNFAEV